MDTRPVTHGRRQRVLIALLTMTAIAGCGTAAGPSPSVTAASPAAAASSGAQAPATSPPAPGLSAGPQGGPGVEPLAAWDLNGTGRGDPGDTISFSGNYKYGPDAIVLDGVTSYGATNGPGPLDTSSSYTAAGWVTINDETEYAAVLSQIGDEASAFYLGVAEGVWTFTMKDMDSNEPGHSFRAKAGPPAIDPATWVHVAGVFDATAGEARLYLDGKRAAGIAFDHPYRAGGPMRVGAAQANGVPADLWPGAIAHAAVYQSVVTDEQLAAIIETTRPTTPAPRLTVEPESYGNGVLNGTWDDVLSAEETDRIFTGFSDGEKSDVGYPVEKAAFRLGFNAQKWYQGFVFEDVLWLVDGHPEGDGGVLAIDGDVLTLSNHLATVTYRWSIEDDKLTLTLLECLEGSTNVACGDTEDVRWITARTYTYSGSDPTY